MKGEDGSDFDLSITIGNVAANLLATVVGYFGGNFLIRNANLKDDTMFLSTRESRKAEREANKKKGEAAAASDPAQKAAAVQND